MTHDTRPCGHDTTDTGRQLTATELRHAAKVYGLSPVATENGLAADIARGECPACVYGATREDIAIYHRSIKAARP